MIAIVETADLSSCWYEENSEMPLYWANLRNFKMENVQEWCFLNDGLL